MIELVKLSLKHRFWNKTSMSMVAIIALILSLLMFSDKMIERVFPQVLEKTKINIEIDDAEDMIKPFDKIIKLDKSAHISISKVKRKYFIKSKYRLYDEEKSLINMMIRQYENNDTSKSDITVEFQTDESTQVNDQYIYMIVTAVYFMMLAYSTSIAGEIVSEKSLNVLDLIGSAIDLKYHFYSKIIVGTLSVFIQVIVVVPLITILCILRNIYDQGKGLFSLLIRFGILDEEIGNFKIFFESLNINDGLLKQGLLCLVFMMIGLCIIQTFAVLLSSKIQQIEETGTLQAPFYLILLLVYYFVIYLKASHQLESSVSFILTFIPVFSMLLMPIRILSGNISFEQILLSIGTSTSLLLFMFKYGATYYRYNIFVKKK